MMPHFTQPVKKETILSRNITVISKRTFNSDFYSPKK